MHHAFADKYSDLASPVHGLDPRVKLFGAVSILLSVALTPGNRYGLFIAWGCVIGTGVSLSLVPVWHVLRKVAMVLPFVLMIAAGLPFLREGETLGSLNVGPLNLRITDAGTAMFLAVLLKSVLASLTLVLLAATTRFSDLLKGLRWFGAPRILIMILSFMYRYIFVLVDEVEMVDRARRSRAPGGRILLNIRVLAGVVGLLFIRTYERAERVYQGMLARGFRGDAPEPVGAGLRRADVIAVAVIVTAVAGIWGLS